MAHISELALFDCVARKADLTTEETEHLQHCDDCRDDVIRLRRVVQDSTDINKTRQLLVEEGTLPSEPREERRVA